MIEISIDKDTATAFTSFDNECIRVNLFGYLNVSDIENTVEEWIRDLSKESTNSFYVRKELLTLKELVLWDNRTQSFWLHPVLAEKYCADLDQEKNINLQTWYSEVLEELEINELYTPKDIAKLLGYSNLFVTLESDGSLKKAISKAPSVDERLRLLYVPTVQVIQDLRNYLDNRTISLILD